jgi:hypothetical protein
MADRRERLKDEEVCAREKRRTTRALGVFPRKKREKASLSKAKRLEEKKESFAQCCLRRLAGIKIQNYNSFDAKISLL